MHFGMFNAHMGTKCLNNICILEYTNAQYSYYTNISLLCTHLYTYTSTWVMVLKCNNENNTYIYIYTNNAYILFWLLLLKHHHSSGLPTCRQSIKLSHWQQERNNELHKRIGHIYFRASVQCIIYNCLLMWCTLWVGTVYVAYIITVSLQISQVHTSLPSLNTPVLIDFTVSER